MKREKNKIRAFILRKKGNKRSEKTHTRTKTDEQNKCQRD